MTMARGWRESSAASVRGRYNDGQAMAVSFQLPTDLEHTLRRETDDLDAEAKEALLVSLYKREKLTHHQLGEALGVSRFAVDAVLKRHGVFHDMTADDVVRESEGLRQLRDGANADRG